MAAKAAMTALVVAAEAAVDRCGLGHDRPPQVRPTGTEDGQDLRGGERGAVHGEVPETPPLQRELFQLFEEEPSGAPLGSLAEPQGAQTRGPSGTSWSRL